MGFDDVVRSALDELPPEIAAGLRNVAVVVEDGGGQGQSGSGNTIAAPIAKKVMEAVLSR